MEAPEKIYIHPDIGGREFIKPWLHRPANQESVEYVRKDLFIEEAADYIKRHSALLDSDGNDCMPEWIENFIKTMKYFAPDEREDAEEYMKERRTEKDYVHIFQVIDMNERDAEFKLKDKHYERMEHCIGIEQDKVKDGLYKAYRNGSCYNECIPEWEDLVRNGYAKRWGEIAYMIFYGLTRKGFEAIARRWGILIRYEIEVG